MSSQSLNHIQMWALTSNFVGKNVHSGLVLCLAATGAQTCVSDTSVLNTLGISVDSLLPTRHKLISATKNQLAVNGVIMVKFENKSHPSNQLLYIFDNISGLYLSEKAQIDLKMIPSSYPFCDPSQETSQVSHVEDPLPPTGSPYNSPLWLPFTTGLANHATRATIPTHQLKPRQVRTVALVSLCLFYI